jgi:formylglycine-generating enzyme required for sulfatase activity
MKSGLRLQAINTVLHSLILILSVNTLILSIAYTQEEDLPIEIQADIIMKSAKQNIVEEKWDAAVLDFVKLSTLWKNLPNEFYYNYGKVLFKTGKYDNSLVNLKKYIKLEGRDGEYYSDFLDFIIEVEEKLIEQDEKKELTERFLEHLYENMVLVKGGCFKIGETFRDGIDTETPMHEACVDDFYIGKYEVKIDEFRQFTKETGYKTEAETGDGMHYWTGSEFKKDKYKYWNNPGFSQTDIHPVVGVSWNDAQEYVNWLSDKTGKEFRLPTEAEWEYASRSGGRTEKWSGTNNESEIGRYAWYKGNSGKRNHPVGQKWSNKLGLYDMSGNVWE